MNIITFVLKIRGLKILVINAKKAAGLVECPKNILLSSYFVLLVSNFEMR